MCWQEIINKIRFIYTLFLSLITKTLNADTFGEEHEWPASVHFLSYNRVLFFLWQEPGLKGLKMLTFKSPSAILCLDLILVGVKFGFSLMCD